MTHATKRRLPPAKAWRERELSDWNTLTFTEYLRDRHRELYGIDYVPGRGGWRREQGEIKRMVGEHGTEVVRRFIDACFREYRPTREYPGINFTFMSVYMKGRVLPKVLAEVAREKERGRAVVDAPSAEELAGWL
ncbi:hypothetical protein I532_04180 [Brevibacillus borstelensis AK1]|uniref:Uncharacterized protein n=1 Tax=Brevibacillus borstelensis AK1 TaxID=1300222 RepID=M8DEK0_9BACL|nr:hypothetical protein [Brevibacillus borstelensis]EMT54774.1 hypothetical protein I532_04180 [Brevibacillus borstelensis AK1]